MTRKPSDLLERSCCRWQLGVAAELPVFSLLPHICAWQTHALLPSSFVTPAQEPRLVPSRWAGFCQLYDQLRLGVLSWHLCMWTPGFHLPPKATLKGLQHCLTSHWHFSFKISAEMLSTRVLSVQPCLPWRPAAFRERPRRTVSTLAAHTERMDLSGERRIGVCTLARFRSKGLPAGCVLCRTFVR